MNTLVKLFESFIDSRIGLYESSKKMQSRSFTNLGPKILKIYYIGEI